MVKLQSKACASEGHFSSLGSGLYAAVRNMWRQLQLPGNSIKIEQGVRLAKCGITEGGIAKERFVTTGFDLIPVEGLVNGFTLIPSWGSRDALNDHVHASTLPPGSLVFTPPPLLRHPHCMGLQANLFQFLAVVLTLTGSLAVVLTLTESLAVVLMDL